MKKLVLAEKPSVGREIARVLGCRNCQKYYESDAYVVTWALGHLVSPAKPDHYGPQYRRWTMSNLPILPQRLDNEVIDKTKEQYALVSSLLSREDVGSIVIATDAGREGELVARWILQMADCHKPIQRLWISSQTDAAILEGFADLRPGEQYDNLYHAAECRSAADWYVGYNVSRAMSCHYDTQLSAGRVQTPTLALMVQREHQINDFTGKFYWTIKADFGTFSASLFRDGTIRIPSEDEAVSIADSVRDASGTITAVSEISKTEKPPLAYDLTELQRDANTALGFSAKETLDTLQRLYEVHKIVTYPRTDSRYITADIVPTLPQRLKALTGTPFESRALSLAAGSIRSDLGNLVDDSKVSDHHALLPTEQPVDLSKLSENERRLWELVMMRFLETLSPDYVYRTTSVTATVSGQTFISRLSIPQSLGWREVGRDIGRSSTCVLADDVLEGRISLAAELSEGSPVTVREVKVSRFATPAPERYTEATLLYAMEHAGSFVEDADRKKHLANGLGTPATRADIIEKLISNRCIERQGRNLVPTPKGMELVRLVPEQLRSPELTARWEERLGAISAGEESPRDFIEDIKKNASELVTQVARSTLKYDPTLMGEKACPHCGWPMLRVADEYGQIHYICQRFSCGYEEKEVKIKEKVETTEPPESTEAGKQTAVLRAHRTIASASPSEPGAKKVVVLKKSAIKKAEPKYVWKTVIEVVKPSHFRPRPEFSRPDSSHIPGRPDNRHTDNRRPADRHQAPDRPRQGRPDKTDLAYYANRSSSGGGTLADFFNQQKEREKRDREKRRK